MAEKKESPGKENFRTKSRDRKSPYAEIKKEIEEKRGLRKKPVVKQKPPGKYVGCRFNAKQYAELQELKEHKQYSNDSITIKETIRLAYELENEVQKIADRLRDERRRWNIPLRRLE